MTTPAASVVTYGGGSIRRGLMKPNSHAMKPGIPAAIQNWSMKRIPTHYTVPLTKNTRKIITKSSSVSTTNRNHQLPLLSRRASEPLKFCLYGVALNRTERFPNAVRLVLA